MLSEKRSVIIYVELRGLKWTFFFDDHCFVCDVSLLLSLYRSLIAERLCRVRAGTMSLGIRVLLPGEEERRLLQEM